SAESGDDDTHIARQVWFDYVDDGLYTLRARDGRTAKLEYFHFAKTCEINSLLSGVHGPFPGNGRTSARYWGKIARTGYPVIVVMKEVVKAKPQAGEIIFP